LSLAVLLICSVLLSCAVGPLSLWAGGRESIYWSSILHMCAHSYCGCVETDLQSMALEDAVNLADYM